MTIPNRQVELRYDPIGVDQKWQSRWALDNIYRVNDDDPRPKWFEMTMYPYPSGDLHIGHWYAMAPADCHARFRRMQKFPDFRGEQPEEMRQCFRKFLDLKRRKKKKD